MENRAGVMIVMMVGLSTMVLLGLLWVSGAPVSATASTDETMLINDVNEGDGELPSEVVDVVEASTSSNAGDDSSNGQDAFDSEPSPSLSPRDVVLLQIKALKKNNEADEGIATCFRFASPSNRKITGPVERFKKMLHVPPYDQMLGVNDFSVSEPQIEGDKAVLLVKLIDANDETLLFVFELSKQTEKPYDGCWMTDAVFPVSRPKAPEKPTINI